MKAAGAWAWWNQYGSVPLDRCLVRARQVAGIIVKAGHWAEFDAFKAVGPVAVEYYVGWSGIGGPAAALVSDTALLNAGLDRGAEFAVINAEVEWESLLDESLMMQLITDIRAQHPGVELYASIDSRGGRMQTPALRALIRECTGVMPEVYPKAFRPAMPPGSVAAAFVDSVDHGDFQGKPVLPSLQTYDGIGAAAVTEQVAQCVRDRCIGWQAYTLAHATDEEWAAFVAGIPVAIGGDLMSQEADAIRAEMKQGFGDVERFMVMIAQSLQAQIAALHAGDTSGLQAQIDALNQRLKDAAAKLGG